MYRIFTLTLAIIAITLGSCTNDVEVNTPALQAMKGDDLFRAEFRKAVIHEDGTLVISGSYGEESLSFTTTASTTGKYKLSDETTNKASFTTVDRKSFTGDRDTDGEIEITNDSNGEVSGRFYFTNLKDDEGNAISIRSGWFYKLPIEDYEEPIQTINSLPENNPCLLNAALSASIDGTEMTTDIHESYVIAPDNSTALLRASNDTQEIEIVFPLDAEPGIHSLVGSGNFSAAYSLYNDKSSALSGQLNIDYHDQDSKCISGSFEFYTRSGVSVSQGAFEFGY